MKKKRHRAKHEPTVQSGKNGLKVGQICFFDEKRGEGEKSKERMEIEKDR